MKKYLVFLVLIVIAGIGFFFLKFNKIEIISPLVSPSKIMEKPLEKYTFERLKNTNFPESQITVGRVLKDDNNFSSRVFYFNVNNQKVSGLINLPQKEGIYPVVVMFRGYVPLEIYSIGEGTRRGGEVFAQNGFITLAPDFLGYGESDNPSQNSMEERVQTYTTALTLLNSIKNLNTGLAATLSANIKADENKINLWGHSNGGQITLSVLEITGKNYPTVLWAPVSKPFPYSILYYTDEYDDHGKALRKMVANFENDYDIEKYSLTNYLDWIKAPIQLHQGEADEAVPQKWSDQFYEQMKKLKKEITYFTYPGADHNLAPTGWSTAVQRSIDFFKNN